MVFSSITFLFLFLPLFIGLYYLFSLPVFRKGKLAAWSSGNLLLLGASLLFYAWGERLLVSIMVGSTVIDYLCGLLMAGVARRGWRQPIQALPLHGPRSAVQKTALFASIAGNLCFLCLFKYYNFFIESFAGMLSLLGLHDDTWFNTIQLALPMGISFYTFQSMSYSIDVYRGKIKATKNIIDFACFVTLFPQLVAGPIVRYKDIATQLVKRTLSLENFSDGAKRFMIGLGKKVLIADVLAQTADNIYALSSDHVTCSLAWLGTVCFTFQLYFDFSGYSDMAIGLGRIFGFRLPENFNYPLISKSLKEYWCRWHITLGTWFKDYLFFPLGGSRGSVPRVYLNLFTVFFLCGLWHGASWNYVLWGLFNGLFLILERLGLGKALTRIWSPWAHLYFLLLTLSTKVVFRSATLGQAGVFFTAMAGFNNPSGELYPIHLFLNPEMMIALVMACIGCTPALPVFNRWIEEKLDSISAPFSQRLWVVISTVKLVVLFSVFALSLLWVANVTYNPFIYFRF